MPRRTRCTNLFSWYCDSRVPEEPWLSFVERGVSEGEVTLAAGDADGVPCVIDSLEAIWETVRSELDEAETDFTAGVDTETAVVDSMVGLGAIGIDCGGRIAAASL